MAKGDSKRGKAGRMSFGSGSKRVIGRKSRGGIPSAQVSKSRKRKQMNNTKVISAMKR